MVQSWLPSLLIAIAAVITVGATIYSARTAAFVAKTAARRSEVQNISEMLNQYRTDNIDLRKQLEEQVSVIKALRETRDTDQLTIAELRKMVEDLNSKIAAMEAGMTADQKRITDLVATLNEQERQLARQARIIANQAARIEDLEAQKTALEAQRLALESRVAALESENAELRARRNNIT